MSKVKRSCKAGSGTPSHSCWMSLAIWDHLLSDTSENTPP